MKKKPMVIHVFYMLNTNVSVDNYYLKTKLTTIIFIIIYNHA